MSSAEQKARDLLERMGIEDAQSFTAGDVLELANLIAERGSANALDGLERTVRVRPAYDCIGVQPCVHGSERCKPGTGGSHGRHNAELHLTVRGADVEITLVISTGWDLPTVPGHQRIDQILDSPRGSFVETHTAHPRYAGQDRSDPRPDGTCKGWPSCYLDAGYGMSDEPTRLLVAEGSDATWAWLETLYATTQADITALQSQTIGSGCQ